ncbi:hypothetical protein LTR70_000044 [Exophiala xenobiotica]|uniref:Uncharacterized protein n=1 Tax=Lithohypha guttulata TaxID=1690604 RepID=A0ABR0JXR7_9EURO|nr:hypothetical protein LTR24_009300 [Lithohypha guttulata]KAK5330722.1 hypothetical protein LTR70_000044 [Exophiala xenobiotica]
MANPNLIQETLLDQEASDMDTQGKFDPASTEVLRQTQFMGKPLLVNEPLMSMSAIAYPGDLPTAQGFAAFHPNIGRITAKDGRRQELFLRLNKMSMVTKAYQKQSPPQGPTPPVAQRKEAPKYQPFSKVVPTAPAIWPADDILSKSGLFTTPPTSPQQPKGRFPEITTRRMPAPISTYEAYRPTTTAAAPKLTSTAEASKRPLKRARTNVAYKPRAASVQDTDYNFIDLASPSPSPSPPTAASSPSPRKFSFDANAPADWELIQTPSRHSASASAPPPPPSRTPTPPPKDLPLRTRTRNRNRTSQTLLYNSNSSSSADELYFTPLPSLAECPSLETINLNATERVCESIDIATAVPASAPLPTTRFYGSPVYTQARFMRRRSTTKLQIYASCEGGQCELREFEVMEKEEEEPEPSYYRQVTVGEKDEWRVW